MKLALGNIFYHVVPKFDKGLIHAGRKQHCVKGGCAAGDDIQNKVSWTAIVATAMVVFLLGAFLVQVYREGSVVLVSEDDQLVVFEVRLDKLSDPEGRLKKEGWVVHTEPGVRETRPIYSGHRERVYLFKPDKSRYTTRTPDGDCCIITNDEIDVEYRRRKFKPAPMELLSQINAGHPSFAENHPNLSQWRDARGRYYYVAFLADPEANPAREAIQARNEMGWGPGWYFAGIRE